MSQPTVVLNKKTYPDNLEFELNIHEQYFNLRLYPALNEVEKEDLSHINTDHINEEWNVIHRNNTEDYIRAGNLIVSFHNMVNQNVLNRNIKLPYPTSSGVKINTIPKPIHEGIDQTLKIRSGQLLTFKEKISVGENTPILWKHIEEFHKLGKCYKANKAEHTRIVINCIKFALL
jgi:hypothetical protein